MKPIIVVAVLSSILLATPVWADSSADIREMKKTIATLQEKQKSQSKRLAEFEALKKRIEKVENSARATGQGVVSKTSADRTAKLERRIVDLERAQKTGGVANRPGTSSSLPTHEELVQKFLGLRTRVAKLERASGYGSVWKDIKDEFSFLSRKLTELESRINAAQTAVSVTGGKLVLSAPNVEIKTGNFTVKSGMSDFKGTVKSTTLVTKSVVAQEYTPGVGNIQ